jgi:hypothetical protein
MWNVELFSAQPSWFFLCVGAAVTSASLKGRVYLYFPERPFYPSLGDSTTKCVSEMSLIVLQNR